MTIMTAIGSMLAVPFFTVIGLLLWPMLKATGMLL